MNVALRGMGATYVDTGGNITPANFFQICCQGNWFGTTFASQACKDFGDANAAMFGPPGSSYCSKVAQDLAALDQAAGSIPIVAPPPPPIDAAGFANVPVFACPASVSPCPCDGRPVVTAQDANDLLTCQALQQQSLQNAAIRAGMKQASSDLCAIQAASCAAGVFGSFMSPSTDCTTCVLDFTKGSTLLLIAAVGFFLFMAVKLR
jgi:hypothetical protein